MNYLSDPVFQTVQWLREGASGSQSIGSTLAEAWRGWTGAACQHVEVQIGFTNYKPFERARIVAKARLSLGDGAADAKQLTLLLNVFAEPEAAQEEFDRGTSEPLPAGDAPPPLCLPSRGLVVWTLPNLRELRQVMNPEGFRSLLPWEAAGPAKAAHFEAPALEPRKTVLWVPYV